MKTTKHTRESFLDALHTLDNNIIAVAMDKDGDWYGYESIPKRDGYEWLTENESFLRFKRVEVTYEGDWKDSLLTLEVDEAPTNDTPRGTPVQVKLFNYDKWHTEGHYYFIRVNKAGKFIVEDGSGGTYIRNECRIVKEGDYR